MKNSKEVSTFRSSFTNKFTHSFDVLGILIMIFNVFPNISFLFHSNQISITPRKYLKVGGSFLDS